MYRLQKLLSLIGYCSRRTAERLIESRKIKINDSIAQVGDKWNNCLLYTSPSPRD